MTHHPIYLLTEDECAELHGHIAGVLRCAGLPDGPLLDETIATCFTAATSAIDKHRAQVEKRHTNIRKVKG